MNKKSLILAASVVVLVIFYFGMSAYLKHRTISYLNDFATYMGVENQLKHGAVKVNPFTMNGQVKSISIDTDGFKLGSESLNFNALSKNAVIDNITIAGPFQSAEIDKINVNKYVLEGGIPKTTDIEAQGISLVAPSLSNTSDGKVKFNFAIATEADFENLIYKYNKINLDIPGLMNLDLNFAISGFDIKKYAEYSNLNPEALGQDEEFARQITQDLAQLKLNDLKLTFKDLGIVSKHYLETGIDDGSTIEERKAKITEALDAYAESAESEFDAKISQDIKKFILGDNKEATFTVAPSEPVVIQSMVMDAMMGASTDELVNLLGLSYTVK